MKRIPADKITLELFTNQGGFCVYMTDLQGTRLVGCTAKPSLVDGLIRHIAVMVEEKQEEQQSA